MGRRKWGIKFQLCKISSGKLYRNVISHTVLCTQNFGKSVVLILSALTSITTTKKQNLKEQDETFGGDKYVFDLDCDDGFMGVIISQK